ncbi:BTAD domain-containing putative transcriptional regulator [Streptomyces sp. NPDC005811]|uniref:AfsR/SARP family transcriptional regulator n=1 Tax=Streptomyces sp. NPDC005811 TaxID=3154565 RepID=UPI0033E28363
MSDAALNAVRFSVLGPVRAWRAGRELDLGPPQQRATLAVLLVCARRPVGLSEITQVLWGLEPPVSAANVVHRHIGMLRRLLEPGLPNRAEGQWLVRVGGGYRLRVATEDVDLLRFRRLRDLTREADPDGTPVQAVEQLDEALALWQGPVAAGIPATVRGHRIFTALEREYLAAARDAAGLALRHGVADRILGSLERCAARHPLDQQIQALLALALAATGHQAEALEICRLTRVRLAEELGISSGPELRAAHQRILEGDRTSWPVTAHTADEHLSACAESPEPGGTRASTAHPELEPESEWAQSAHTAFPRGLTTRGPNGAPTAPPRQLPAPPAVLVGRQTETDRLLALVEEAGPEADAMVLGVVCGPAGVGKSALAVSLAHRLASNFPDGQLHLELRGFDPSSAPCSPAEALGRLLESLGVPAREIPEDLDARTALYRSLLAGRRVLVLLDDALDAEHVRPLLPGGPGCLVLVTSRSRLSGLVASQGAHRIILGPLGPGHAYELLASRVGSTRLDAHKEAAERTLADCAGLPLALAAAADAAAAHTDPTASDVFAGADPVSVACGALRASYEKLAAETARLFRLLALHPGPDADLASVSALAGLEQRHGRVLLAELTELNLVTEAAAGRFAPAAPEHAYATHLVNSLDDAEARRAAVHRLLTHVLRTAHEAAALVEAASAGPRGGPYEAGTAGFPDAAAATAWFTAELPTLLEAVRLAAKSAEASDTTVTAWQLTAALEPLFERYPHDHEWVLALRTVLAETPDSCDLPGLARTHRALGRACTRLRRYEEASAGLAEALGLFARAGGPAQARTHLDIASLHERQGQYGRSASHARSALGLYRAAGDASGEAAALSAAGRACDGLGDFAEALRLFHRSAVLHGGLGDPHGEATAWSGAGDAQRHLGFPAQAADCYEHAVSLLTGHHPADAEAVTGKLRGLERTPGPGDPPNGSDPSPGRATRPPRTTRPVHDRARMSVL